MKSIGKILILTMMLSVFAGCTARADTPAETGTPVSPSSAVTAAPTPSTEPAATLPPKPVITPPPAPSAAPGNISDMMIPQSGYCVNIMQGERYVNIEETDLAVRLVEYCAHPEYRLTGGAECPMHNTVTVYKDGIWIDTFLAAADRCRTVLKGDTYYIMPMDLYIDLYYAAYDRGLYLYGLAVDKPTVARRLTAFHLQNGAYIKTAEWGFSIAEGKLETERTKAVMGLFARAYYALTPCEIDERAALTKYIEVDWSDPDYKSDGPRMDMFKVWSGGGDYFVIEQEDGSKESFRGEEMRDLFAGIFPE
jgi:hypothetical protein